MLSPVLRQRPVSRLPGSSLGGTLAAISGFLEAAREPVLLEPGEPAFPLVKGSWSCEPRSSHVLLEAWDEHRNLARRVTRVVAEERGKLTLEVDIFGSRPGKLELIDHAAAKAAIWQRRGVRLVYRERFRDLLTREFPGWKIEELSSEIDLEHSLSPVFPRALLTRGKRAMAAIAAPPESGARGILSYGLIWLEYLRKRERRLGVEGLILAVPKSGAQETAHRLRYLNHDRARFELLAYTDEDFIVRLDPRDAGNLETKLEPCWSAPPVAENDGLRELEGIEGFERLGFPDGSASLRIHGLEFGRIPGRVSQSELIAHGRELSRLRNQRGSLLYRKEPERWLESEVRAHITAIDVSLMARPVYGQVPAMAGGDRGIADLLAIGRDGRLAVIEIKAEADLHLPLQALDYWMRVAHHAAAREFGANGYFPAMPASPERPRLLLVAPALEFHSTTETILSYFSPEIEVDRIGVGVNWREEIRVMFRLRGAERP